MTYNFEQWHGEGKHERGKSFSTHVRFGKSQMYISTRLLKKEPSEGGADGRYFDLLVDEGQRVFALKFLVSGQFCIRSEPGQVSVGTFVSCHKPILNKRIHMRYSEEHQAWVGSLDGKGLQ